MSLRDRIQSASRLGLALCEKLTWLPPLVARITVGLVFVWSGWGKLHNLDAIVENFRNWGIPAPEIQAPFASAMELGCGLLLVAGLFTRLASVPLMVIMVVAMKSVAFDPKAAADQGTFNYLFGLSEYLYIALLVWLAIYGAGALSLDRLLFAHWKKGR